MFVLLLCVVLDEEEEILADGIITLRLPPYRRLMDSLLV